MSMGPFNNPAVVELLSRYKSIAAMTHTVSLFQWDLEINMPEAGAMARGQAQSEIDLLRQKMTIDLAGAVEKVDKLKTLNDAEKGVIRVVKRELDYYQKVPAKLVEELNKTAIEASIPWRESRKKSDFKMFKPHLERMTELKKEEAHHLKPSASPYDALLDLSEEGLTTRDLDGIFGELIPALKKILLKTLSAGVFQKTHPLEDADYDVDALKQVNAKVLQLLGMPEKRFRQDVSTHPFAIKIASDDVRITTRYEPKDFRASMFGLMHECGHALYELQIDHDLQFTPSATGVSAGVHESQSRFWENIVGRSRDFVPLLYPILKSNLDFVSRYDQKSLYSYFNLIKPSLIRVEADELTYNFHIAMRYEIEKKLLEGKVNVSELPSVWDDTIEDFLGVRPEKDAEGVLQDVHWSWGQFATFPGYSLGNVVAGMLWQALTKRGLLPVKDEKSIGLLKAWLAENIHRPGSTYSPKELLNKVFGKGYDPSGLVGYLEHKYLAN